MTYFPPSELIINPDGSIYHLHLRPEQLAPLVITVGDPDRVPMVSKYFDRIDEQVQKREFITHTGWLGQRRISVISTGIGTDNIDIVLTELDALMNIDFATRQQKKTFSPLQIIRIGTSGALQADTELDSLLLSNFGIGLDGLLLYYQASPSDAERELERAFQDQLGKRFQSPIQPYFAQADSDLVATFKDHMQQGITVTCPGFYGPQGRELRTPMKMEVPLNQMRNFQHQGMRITNFEMETAAIYGMANLLGHKALSCNALIANRTTNVFSKNSKAPIDRLIRLVLEKVGQF